MGGTHSILSSGVVCEHWLELLYDIISLSAEIFASSFGFWLYGFSSTHYERPLWPCWLLASCLQRCNCIRWHGWQFMSPQREWELDLGYPKPLPWDLHAVICIPHINVMVSWRTLRSLPVPRQSCRKGGISSFICKTQTSMEFYSSS